MPDPSPPAPRASYRRCAWCRRPIPPGKRADSIYDRTACRQAAHRFKIGAERRVASSSPRRFGYLDPPYPGKSDLYVGHPDYAGEVDHAALIAWAVDEFPDGWALSTSAEALQDVYALCPPGTRCASWHRGARGDSFTPLNAWEPVLYWGGREDPDKGRRLDTLTLGVVARTTDPNRVMGAKPARFCYWMFDLLGALPGDELVDVFPGSGGVARAWQIYASISPAIDASA